MTGTVLDGAIDVAIIKTDGESIHEFGHNAMVQYKPTVIELLFKTLEAAKQWQFEGPEPAIFKLAEREITLAQTAAVKEVVGQSQLTLKDIGVVGFHGQTVLHRSAQKSQKGQTRQLGNGFEMAEQLGVPVAFDFRSADVQAGGQGAPLCPAYHLALLRHLNVDANSAMLNLGGVANITWWDGKHELAAFDTGPANAPLNDFINQCGLGRMDKDGNIAAKGSVDEAKLKDLLKHPYFTKAYPKSLDRFDFTANLVKGYSAEDGAALLTAFIAASVNAGLNLLPQRPSQLIVCGGGAHNPTLLNEISSRARVRVLKADDLGLRSDVLEAECFAYLGVRTFHGLPISFPNTTGVSKPLTGGQLTQ